MAVFKFPESGVLADKYQGAGYALAATVDGHLVDMVYLRDAVPAFGDLDEPGPEDVFAAMDDPAIAPTVRKLQALGEVVVGMCSAYEFVVL
jgi:hypothetical protein